MNHSANKRAFLTGRFDRPAYIRPPGSDADFYDLCTQCGDCARACPSAIIYRDSDGFPVVNLRAGECLFCSDCATACDTGAIRPATGWQWRAHAMKSCMAMSGTTCRICEDQCDARAIRFRLLTGGRSVPDIDPDTCTGCGACAAPCPTGSITFYEHSQPHEEKPC